MVAMPSILDTIQEEVEDEDEDPKDNIPRSKRTRVTMVVEEQKRNSLSFMSPLTHDKPIQVDEVTDQKG